MPEGIPDRGQSYIEAVQEYFRLFYHCDITPEQYDALVANSLGQQADSLTPAA